MALPRMHSDPTALDRVAGVRRLTPATTIAAAQAHEQATGEAATGALEAGRPVGVVTAAALAGAWQSAARKPRSPRSWTMSPYPSTARAMPTRPSGASGEQPGTGSNTARREGARHVWRTPPPTGDTRPQHDRFAVEWALPDDEIGPADVVLRFCEADVQPGDSYCAHCQVCDNHQRMQSAVTADGERYDRCVGCGLLWHVDRHLGRVVGARLMIPR